MGSTVLLLAVAGLTSLAGGLAMRRSGGAQGLGAALRDVLELAGFITLYFLANLALGLAIVLGIRSVSAAFISVYWLNDMALVALSVLQGAVFFFWRRRSGRW